MSSLFSEKNRYIRKSKYDKMAGELLKKLRSYLDANEPGLVRFLVNLWENQGKAITYKELREAFLAGDISSDYLQEWMEDYSRFVVEHLQPVWQDAMKAAAADLEAKYPDWYFRPMTDGIREWAEAQAAEFVTSVSTTQIEGLRAVIQKAIVLNTLSVDELARVIRPMVGLNKPQSTANLNYYNNLINNGVSKKRALELSTRYAARQHRYRGYMIARQEIAMAYNSGADFAVKQAQEAGYLGKMVKVSCCADDEHVCSICGREGLEGAIVGMDEDFNIPNRGTYKFTRRHPPYHIQCRCTVMYIEAEALKNG